MMFYVKKEHTDEIIEQRLEDIGCRVVFDDNGELPFVIYPIYKALPRWIDTLMNLYLYRWGSEEHYTTCSNCGGLVCTDFTDMYIVRDGELLCAECVDLGDYVKYVKKELVFFTLSDEYVAEYNKSLEIPYIKVFGGVKSGRRGDDYGVWRDLRAVLDNKNLDYFFSGDFSLFDVWVSMSEDDAAELRASMITWDTYKGLDRVGWSDYVCLGVK